MLNRSSRLSHVCATCPSGSDADRARSRAAIRFVAPIRAQDSQGKWAESPPHHRAAGSNTTRPINSRFTPWIAPKFPSFCYRDHHTMMSMYTTNTTLAFNVGTTRSLLAARPVCIAPPGENRHSYI